MSKLVVDNELEVLKLEQTASSAGVITNNLATENKFVDKNIQIVTTIPEAGAATLAITDNTGVDVTVGTAAGGYYPLSASISGQMSYATAGWSTTNGASATDSSVVVGQIAQSTLKNGNTSISSGAEIIPNVTTDQTITIEEGHYDDDRTVVVKSMSAGTAAAATVSGTAQATAPTITNTASAVSGKTQVSGAPVKASELASEINKYYMAMTSTAPATEVSLTKNVDTAGYLGADSQIDASAATTQNAELYYVPLATGSVAATMDAATATTPTLANDTTASVSGKTRVNASPTTDSAAIDTFYMAVEATAPATAVTVSKSVTGGYISTDEVSTTGGSVAASDETYYIPLTTGTKSAGAGSVSASSSTMSIALANSEPVSGHYFTTEGSGVSNIGAGWFDAATSQTSNTATAYYTVPDATFSVSGNQITATTAGYVDANDVVGTIATGTLSTGVSSRAAQGYTTLADNSVVIPTDDQGNGGYLYIPAGYYTATEISLGTLIPDNVTEDAVSANILSGYEAFTTDGTRLIGSIPTYDGTYTTT